MEPRIFAVPPHVSKRREEERKGNEGQHVRLSRGDVPAPQGAVDTTREPSLRHRPRRPPFHATARDERRRTPAAVVVGGDHQSQPSRIRTRPGTDAGPGTQRRRAIGLSPAAERPAPVPPTAKEPRLRPHHPRHHPGDPACRCGHRSCPPHLGDLDYTTTHHLRERLTAVTLQLGRRLVPDLAQPGFCDSSGITVPIAAHNQAIAARATLVLAAVPDNTPRILRIVGLDQLFLPLRGHHRRDQHLIRRRNGP
ncbi:STAS domain-containing protein [Streptomyces rubrogriseus]|uniref:STAS domain-containing protein n=1 Tax=Streptomyces rubrogriseus TaxID=194673 RepID=UPI00382F3CCF